MKILFVAFLLTSAAFATRIQDSDIRDSSGRKITTGVLRICPPGSYSSGSWWIAADCVTASITAGALNVVLLPGTYRVRWQSPATEDQSWVVPDSLTSLRIRDVVGASQVDTAGLTDGTYCLVMTGGKVAAVTSPPCGGGGGTSWAGLTSGAWAGLTSGTWAAVTH